MELKKCKLGEIAKTSSGATPTSTKKEYYEGGTIPWINSGELSNPFIIKANNYITKLGFDNSSTRMYAPNDTVLLAMYGATAGKASLLQIEACTNQAICAIIPDKNIVEPLFLKYKLDTMYNYLVGLSTGSARDNLSQAGIANLILDIPSIAVQQKISAILSSLDRKISLNRQINQNLEALAKQLYDYWFVQFDFPNEEGKPYKSSGGAMVYSERLKREIPESWQAVSVNDISESFRGVSYTKDDLVNESQGVLVLRGNNIQDNQLIYDSNVAYIPQSFVSTEQNICKGDIIMTMSSGSKEHVGKCVLFHHNTCETYGAFLTKFSPHPHCSYLLYDVFNSAYFKAKIKSIASGTGINNLTNQTFDNIYIALPPIEILKEFDELQSKIFSEVGVLQQDTWHLIKQRDELLPLLMNGQVSLNSDLSHN